MNAVRDPTADHRPTDRPSAPPRCENCGTALQGGYCHVCGQRAHNPLKHFGHAVEEVFESFWHLDGRIFRTLRDLAVPGRVAQAYLAGHRVRYIAPLRLFIILIVVTFFVGKLALHFDASGRGGASASPESEMHAGITIDVGEDVAEDSVEAADTVEAALRWRETALRDLEGSAKDPVGRHLLAGFGAPIRAQIEERTRNRLRALGATDAQMSALDDASAASAAARAAAASSEDGAKPSEDAGLLQRWLDRRLERMRQNAELVQKSPDELIRLVLGAVPGALFLLVPLFALCLKLLYIRSERSYLEHLVVALYSHAFMLMALLCVFLLVGVQSLPALPAWASGLAAVSASLVLSVAVPLYLLRMQRRVYAQGWLKTLVKYVAVGGVYTTLLSFALVYAVLAGMSS